MEQLEVMRFSWILEGRQNFWELIRNARDEIQYVIQDKSSDTVLVRLGIEPTTFGEKTGPRFVEEDGVLVARTEEDVTCEVELEGEELDCFLGKNCSFTTVRVQLPTEKYGESFGGGKKEVKSRDTDEKLLHGRLIREDFAKKFKCEEPDLKYVTKCIYESGEYCIYQHYYIVEVDSLPLLPDVTLETDPDVTDSLNIVMTTSRDSVVEKLCGGDAGLMVGLKRVDIERFCRNADGRLVSPGLLVCLQKILLSF